jgi:hypothetical protein
MAGPLRELDAHADLTGEGALAVQRLLLDAGLIPVRSSIPQVWVWQSDGEGPRWLVSLVDCSDSSDKWFISVRQEDRSSGDPLVIWTATVWWSSCGSDEEKMRTMAQRAVKAWKQAARQRSVETT